MIKNFKLGKLTPKHDRRTLQFSNYVKYEQLQPIPAAYQWSTKVSAWGMMQNDVLGDCTCAAAGHFIQDWTANSLLQINPTDEQIVAAYSDISGYNAATGLNDNGCVELDVLNYWRKSGIAGHTIEAYAALEPKNILQLKTAVYLFGGVYIGVSLPLSAQTQSVWSIPPGGAIGQGAAGSWGGHAVFICDYDGLGPTCITWGAPVKMTWLFFQEYVDEAYAIISPDFFNENKSPLGFDLEAVRLDLAGITQVA